MTPLLLIQQAIRQRVRRKATSAEQQAIDRIARRLEPQLRKRFLAAVQASKDIIDLEALARAIQSGSVSQASLAMRMGEWSDKYGALATDLKVGFLAGGEIAYEVLDGAKFKLRFDLINSYAVNYASRKLPILVDYYKRDALTNIRGIITQAMEGKYTSQTAAKAIRDSIGLTERQEKAVEHYRGSLIADGITGGRLDGKVEWYGAKLLRARAKTISRTEIIQAQVAGQRALWEAAALEGLFDRHTAKRVWDTHDDERTCTQCREMDGQEIPYNGVYTHTAENDEDSLGSVNVFGEILNGPPLHPNCRCSEELVT